MMYRVSQIKIKVKSLECFLNTLYIIQILFLDSRKLKLIALFMV